MSNHIVQLLWTPVQRIPTPNFFDGLMKKQTYPGAKETYSSKLSESPSCFIHKD